MIQLTPYQTPEHTSRSPGRSTDGFIASPSPPLGASPGSPKSATIPDIIHAIERKLSGNNLGGSAKLVIVDLGTVMTVDERVYAGDDEADVTLTTNADCVQQMLSCAETVVTLYVANFLEIDGDMGVAFKLGAYLSM